MKVETVVDEHRARYIHPSESSSDPNATGYSRWIFPTGGIHFLDSFWRSIDASCLPSCDKLLRNFSSIVPSSPFRRKVSNNAIHPRIIQPVRIPFNFFVSLLLRLLDCFDETARNTSIETTDFFVYQEFKLKIGEEIIFLFSFRIQRYDYLERFKFSV